ncbi:hypothetical protein MSPP1_003128 [Malassezia sp. CBS 17886]|nr:hypothetical protein MSPP1_003128 [Malassezia sp. CBS 17886]
MARAKRRKHAADHIVPTVALPSSYAYPVLSDAADAAVYPPAQGAAAAGTAHPRAPRLRVDSAEERVLGQCARMDEWVARAVQGRGAMVCVPGDVHGVSPLSFRDNVPTFHCALRAADDSGKEVPLVFAGRAMPALHGLLQRHQYARGPLRLFVSGYGAEATRVGSADLPGTGILFAQNRASLKALLTGGGGAAGDVAACGGGVGEVAACGAPWGGKDAPASDAPACDYLVWFDCNRDAPSKLVMHAVRGDGMQAPGKLPDVLATPTSAHGAPLHRATRSPPPDTSSDSWLWTPEPTTHDARADARGRLHKHTYTIVEELRQSRTANVMGVCVARATERPPSMPGRDTMAKLVVSDGSPGAPCPLTINMFAAHPAELPGSTERGEGILVRGVRIGEFQGRAQGVTNAYTRTQWAVWNPRTDAWWYAPQLAADDVSDAERRALRHVVRWVSQDGSSDELRPAGLHASLLPPAAGPRLSTLDQITAHTFFDAAVEIVKVFARSMPPDLYVTDYTSHPLFFPGNDRHLDMHAPAGRSGHVFQVGLWDNHAPLALQLRPGHLIRLENVRVKVNPRTGLLTGALGSAHEHNVRIHFLCEGDSAVEALPRGGVVAARRDGAATHSAHADSARPPKYALDEHDALSESLALWPSP